MAFTLFNPVKAVSVYEFPFFVLFVFTLIREECILFAIRLEVLVVNLKTKILCLAVFSASIQGCSFSSIRASEEGDRSYKRTEAIEEMNFKLLSSVERSLKILATTKNALRVSVSSREKMERDEWMYNVIPDGLGIDMPVDPWVGSLKSVVEMIADFTGYKVESIGTPNPNSRNVKVGGFGKSAVEHLRDVSLQAGCDAMVKPISSSRVIVIDWTYRLKSECK